MTTWFVSRHRGAQAWVASEGFPVDRVVEHLENEVVGPGDIVIGTLPVHLAAAVCARGARYLHLALDVPADKRGVDMDAESMRLHGARLEEYRVERVAAWSPHEL